MSSRLSAVVVSRCLLHAVAVAGLGLGVRRGRYSNPDTGPPEEYYWPHARGTPGQYATSSYTAPEDLGAGLDWSWHHPKGRYHTVVVGAPLVDDRYNIYLAAEDGVRKFSPSGEQLWFYEARNQVPTCPSIMNGTLFGNTVRGEVFAIDMETGRERWVRQLSASAGGDTAYVEAYEGAVITGLQSAPSGGNMVLFGLDAKTGGGLWQYHSDQVLWNVMPVFPGDGSAIVMDIHGGVHKVSLKTGAPIWKTAPPEDAKESFSDGGVMTGPDGTSYTCSNIEHGDEGTKGALRAYRLSDGKRLWSTELDKPCNSWPVVSRDGLSVVVPTGAFVSSPAAKNTGLMKMTATNASTMQQLALKLGDRARKTFGMKDVTGSIRAFSTKTGMPEWHRSLPDYGRVAARGDDEGYLERRRLGHRDQCLPAQFSSPTISGDNTIYVGRADGKLYALKDPWGVGTLTTFDTEAGFLHPGTAFAPGMMAVASCDGLFVFNDRYKYKR